MTEKTGRKRKLVGEKKASAKKATSDARQTIEDELINDLLQFEVPDSPPLLSILNTQQEVPAAPQVSLPTSTPSSTPMISSQVSTSQVSLVSTTSITSSKTTISSQAYIPPVPPSISSSTSSSSLSTHQSQSFLSFPMTYPPPSSSIPPLSQSTSQSFSSFPMTYPPPSSWIPPLSQSTSHQSQSFSSFPMTYPLPSSFEVYVSNTFTEIQTQLDSLDKRLSKLECKKGNAEELGNNALVPSAAGIGKDKMAAISMILSNKTISWKAALRKILVTVFGATTLAQSCAVGKKNSNNKSLNVQTLDSIKGMHNILFTLFYI